LFDRQYRQRHTKHINSHETQGTVTMRFKRILPLALSLSIVVGANAQQADSTKQSGPTPPVPELKSFVSQHEAMFNGQTIRYTAPAR
jgi:hypothetical protein